LEKGFGLKAYWRSTLPQDRSGEGDAITVEVAVMVIVDAMHAEDVAVVVVDVTVIVLGATRQEQAEESRLGG
jgi:hypothetical protein